MADDPFADTKSRHRDFEEVVDYRECDGAWTLGFEDWAKPRLKALGYSHVRFLGGTTFDYDGQGSIKAEFFVYGSGSGLLGM